MGWSLFGNSGSPSTTNSTSNYNDSRTLTENTSTNTSNNTSNVDIFSSTQDKRMVNDHGLAISGDNSTFSLANSGNTTTIDNSSHDTSISSTDYGAVANALQSNTILGQSAFEMMKANLNWQQHTSDSNAVLNNQAIQQIASASNSAVAQIAAIASKPLNAQNPQHILVIVGLVVFGVFAMKGFKI